CEHLPGDLGADGAGLVVVIEVSVAFEQVNDGEIGCRLAVGHRGAFEHQPAVGAVRMYELVDQARLPHARFPDHRYKLPMASSGPLQGVVERLDLCLPSDEAGEPTGGGRLQAPAQGRGSGQLEDFYRLSQTFDGHW